MNISAIILAGGKGTRLRSIINEVPKPMAIVAGKPFLTYILNQLHKVGVRHVVLSVGYKHEVIIDYFGHQFKGMKLDYAVELEPLGTGGGIRQAMDFIVGDTAMVVNGDTFFDIDFASFISFYERGRFDVGLALRQVPSIDRYGSVLIENQRITGFVEKNNTSGPGYINGGIYLINKQLLKQSTPEGNFSFETDFLQTFYNSLLFGGYVDEGYFIDIGIPEDYHKANEYFTKF